MALVALKRHHKKLDPWANLTQITNIPKWKIKVSNEILTLIFDPEIPDIFPYFLMLLGADGGTTADNNVEKSPAGTSKNAPYQSRNIDFNLGNWEENFENNIRELPISSIIKNVLDIINSKTTFRFVSRNG